MSSQHVRLDVNGEVANIVLQRPEKRNALCTSDWLELRRLAWQLEEDNRVGVVVIRGEGEHFCAGSDLDELLSRTPYEAFRNALRIQQAGSALATLRKPSIVSLRGYTMAGGLEYALCGTFRVAGESAVIGLPEVKLGMLPGAGGTQRVIEMAPRSIATQMLLLGESLEAQEALAASLVDFVVPDDEVNDHIDELVYRLLGLGKESVSLILDCFRLSLESKIQGHLLAEAGLFSLTMTTDDYEDRIRDLLSGSRPSPDSSS